MGQTLTRTFIIGRALAADTWLTVHTGVPLLKADAAAIERYLDTLPGASRDHVERALVAWADDAIRRGMATTNHVRDLLIEIDLRDDAPPPPPPKQARAKAAALPRRPR